MRASATPLRAVSTPAFVGAQHAALQLGKMPASRHPVFARA